MIACCGGFRYRPTTSVIFSRNFGSRESLKVSVRCGCRLWARQILLTVDLLTPWLCAIVRQLQCVIPAGLVCSGHAWAGARLGAIAVMILGPLAFAAAARSAWRATHTTMRQSTK